jgi:hypothetical protein
MSRTLACVFVSQLFVVGILRVRSINGFSCTTQYRPSSFSNSAALRDVFPEESLAYGDGSGRPVHSVRL